MNVGWLLDGDMFEGYREELVAAIREHGDEVKLVRTPSPPYRWDDIGCSYRETFPEGSCVIAHGDIELVTRIHRERRWTPGAFCTVENFFWSSYICWCGEYLLNRDYVMLPFGDLDRRRDFLFDAFGRDGRIFLRPDSPLKLFTGQLASCQTWAADLEFMGFYGFPPSSLVIVSSPKEIVTEWRFIVAGGRIVAGCQYKSRDQLDYLPEYEDGAFRLAESVAALGHEPDPVWVLDVCKTTDDEYRVIEIGGFSFSDLYACDKKAIADAVSAAAWEVWKKGIAE